MPCQSSRTYQHSSSFNRFAQLCWSSERLFRFPPPWTQHILSTHTEQRWKDSSLCSFWAIAWLYKQTTQCYLHQLWKEWAKIIILSSFTHLHVVSNMYDFLSSAEHKRRYFEECWQPNSFGDRIDFHSTEKHTYSFDTFLKISLCLCSIEERWCE